LSFELTSSNRATISAMRQSNSLYDSMRPGFGRPFP
jgi:hypothetical protein